MLFVRRDVLTSLHLVLHSCFNFDCIAHLLCETHSRHALVHNHAIQNLTLEGSHSLLFTCN